MEAYLCEYGLRDHFETTEGTSALLLTQPIDLLDLVEYEQDYLAQVLAELGQTTHRTQDRRALACVGTLRIDKLAVLINGNRKLQDLEKRDGQLHITLNKIQLGEKVIG